MAATGLAGTLGAVFEQVRDAVGGADGELLARYRTRRDEDAFGSLVRRHGPMVLGVCRRVLRDAHAADDAFQVTFLVLARKADAVRPPDRLAPWLYGVAYRTALRARGRAARRQQVEGEYAAQSPTTPTQHSQATDLPAVLDEQVNALPEKYRVPLVLCGIQGLNKAEAAARLGLPEGTVSSRLARARDMLRERLARRGVVVPATSAFAILSADELHAAVPPMLTANAFELATSGGTIPPAIQTLTLEVIHSMTPFKLNVLGPIALGVTLVGGGFGLIATQADEKKPAAPDAVKKAAKPDGDKPGSKPDGEKPAKPAFLPSGKIASVDAKAGTITLLRKGDGGVTEVVVKLAAGAKVFVDGKEAKLADVPKDAHAALAMTRTKEGAPPETSEVRVTGGTVAGVIAHVDAKSLTLDGVKNFPAPLKLAADTKVTANGKDAKVVDLKAGDRVTVTLTTDGSGAVAVAAGSKGDGEKPNKTPKFAGKVATVDAAARTVGLVTKGEAGNAIVVKLTDDAKVTIDGKDAKVGDIAKGATATFTLVAAKDGQPRTANEVVVSGLSFSGSIKRIDGDTLTVGNEKFDRVLKLAAGGKVVVDGKDLKVSDLKVGDRVTVTLTSDDSAAVLIAVGKKGESDKPKSDKGDGDKPKSEKANPDRE
jgi:RNA polymerase sigma factor (sigma-70 family)